MLKRVFVFNWITCCLAISCTSPVSNGSHSRIDCYILDVGQGLSQIITNGKSAVVIDLGKEKYSERWLRAYGSIGSPYIEWICISHTDEDHAGGLRSLPASVPFSKKVYLGAMVDSVLIRSYVQHLGETVDLCMISRGDSIKGPASVNFTCLWPPAKPLETKTGEATYSNKYSLCLRGDYVYTSFMITSDIDSTSMRQIAAENKYRLDIDWLVVPHHGSRGSLQTQFYGYASPRRAVISCGKDNAYEHPAPDVERFLTASLRIPIDMTPVFGNIRYSTNGYYWNWE